MRRRSTASGLIIASVRSIDPEIIATTGRSPAVCRSRATREGGGGREGGNVSTEPRGESPKDPDSHKGAVEGDRPDEPQFYNPNVDDQGRPANPDAACEDAIGANVDESQG